MSTWNVSWLNLTEWASDRKSSAALTECLKYPVVPERPVNPNTALWRFFTRKASQQYILCPSWVHNSCYTCRCVHGSSRKKTVVWLGWFCFFFKLLLLLLANPTNSTNKYSLQSQCWKHKESLCHTKQTVVVPKLLSRAYSRPIQFVACGPYPTQKKPLLAEQT